MPRAAIDKNNIMTMMWQVYAGQCTSLLLCIVILVIIEYLHIKESHAFQITKSIQAITPLSECHTQNEGFCYVQCMIMIQYWQGDPYLVVVYIQLSDSVVIVSHTAHNWRRSRLISTMTFNNGLPLNLCHNKVLNHNHDFKWSMPILTMTILIAYSSSCVEIGSSIEIITIEDDAGWYQPCPSSIAYTSSSLEI